MSTEQILSLVASIVGVILIYVVGKSWALNNGKAIGRKIGQWIPGDKVEPFLVEFLSGLKQGLEETYTEKTVEVAQQEAVPGRTIYSVTLKANPLSSSTGSS